MSSAEEGPIDYLHSAEKLMDRLSTEELDPRPHFRILPPTKEEDAPRLWEVENRNEVGYIVEDKNTSNRIYHTTIRFKGRVGLAHFVECVLVVEKKLGQAGFATRLNVGGNDIGEAQHSERISELLVPLIGGVEPKQMSLKLVKDIKRSVKGNQILLKLANQTSMERLKDGQRTFDFGNLLDLRIQESSEGQMNAQLEDVKGYGLLPVKYDGSTNSLLFRDYYVSSTQIPRPRHGFRTIAQLSQEYRKTTGREIDGAIRAFVEKKIESVGGRLYEFQNRAILSIGSQISGSRKPCLLIARTAAGKTEAFLVPILDWIIRLRGEPNSNGVKALFFYPTKALASDQLQRIIELLHSVNKLRTGAPITVGVYHGDIEERMQLDIPLPLRCVLHEEEIASGVLKSGDVRLRPDPTSKSLKCSKCREAYPFVLADRYSVTMKLPDILVCTPDVVNYILMRDRRRHVFFGSKESIVVCENCRAVCNDDERNCKRCGVATKDVVVVPEVSPQVALLDELHLFSGIFGGNISNFLKRLSSVIRKYGKSDQKPLQFVATSATIGNPAEFGREFFGTEVSLTVAAPEEYDYSQATSKVVVFLSPRAYRMIDSVSYTLYELLRSTNIRVLLFVNSLTLCSMLLTNVKQRLSADPNSSGLADMVDGHNSTYTRQERAETEEKFNRGEIRALIATSTLEVGVDFKDLDGMILYGAPYNFNNYLQRVGRAGRNNDAVVFNFLSPTDPIDLFYYRNAIRLAKDPTGFIEYPPFPAGNNMLAQKHVLASLFDACTLFGLDPTTVLKTFRADPNLISEVVKSYLTTLWEPNQIQEASRRLHQATVAVTSDSELPESTIRRFKLLDLRRVDDTVFVEFEEPAGSGFRNRREPPMDSALRKLGVPLKDREILHNLRRK